MRRIHDLALPGDEETVLGDLTRRAVRRDDRLTLDELIAVACTRQQILYGYCILPGACPLHEKEWTW